MRGAGGCGVGKDDGYSIAYYFVCNAFRTPLTSRNDIRKVNSISIDSNLVECILTITHALRRLLLYMSMYGHGS